MALARRTAGGRLAALCALGRRQLAAKAAGKGAGRGRLLFQADVLQERQDVELGALQARALRGVAAVRGGGQRKRHGLGRRAAAAKERGKRWRRRGRTAGHRA